MAVVGGGPHVTRGRNISLEGARAEILNCMGEIGNRRSRYFGRELLSQINRFRNKGITTIGHALRARCWSSMRATSLPLSSSVLPSFVRHARYEIEKEHCGVSRFGSMFRCVNMYCQLELSIIIHSGVSK
jgi:hypothetical protein